MADKKESSTTCDLIWNIFGSETSTDCDIMVLVSNKLTVQQSQKACEKYKQELKNLVETKKELNINVAVVEDGVITWVYKGTPDECNNSIYLTYEFHRSLQKHQCFIKKLMERNIKVKIIRALRVILTMLSRTNMRPQIKKALQTNTVNARVSALQLVQMQLIQFTENPKTIINNLKTIAFQIGQTMALINKKELYTKTSVGKEYPDLDIFLQRQAYNEKHLIGLTALLQELLKQIIAIIRNDNDFGNVKEVLP